jgi:hypothetical protein
MNKKIFNEVVKAICQDKLGNLEFIITQYLSELQDDKYIKKLYKCIK